MKNKKQLSRKEKKERTLKFREDFKNDISFFMTILSWKKLSILLTGDHDKIRKTEIYVKYINLMSALNNESKTLTFITEENKIPPAIDTRPKPLSHKEVKAYNRKQHKEINKSISDILVIMSWGEVSKFLTGNQDKIRKAAVSVKYTEPLKKMAKDCKRMVRIIERNKKKYLTE